MAPNPETRLISGSEVKAWQECQMKWWFQFRLGIAPQKLSDALFIGTIGHIALSDFYTDLAIGGTPDRALNKMRHLIAREQDKNNNHMMTGFVNPIIASKRMELIAQLTMILEEYAEYYGQDDYTKYDVVEVEHMHVSGNFSAMRLDLLMRNLENGGLELWDHKFVSDFYGEKLLQVNSQLPLYMKVVIGDREEEVYKGVLNQLKKKRTQEELKKGIPRFRRNDVKYNEVVSSKRTRDQHLVSEDIRPHYRLKLMESKDKIIRTMKDHTCQFCPFWELCVADLEGREGDMKSLVRLKFERSTYGYNH